MPQEVSGLRRALLSQLISTRFFSGNEGYNTFRLEFDFDEAEQLLKDLCQSGFNLLPKNSLMLLMYEAGIEFWRGQDSSQERE